MLPPSRVPDPGYKHRRAFLVREHRGGLCKRHASTATRTAPHTREHISARTQPETFPKACQRTASACSFACHLSVLERKKRATGRAYMYRARVVSTIRLRCQKRKYLMQAPPLKELTRHALTAFELLCEKYHDPQVSRIR